MNSFATVRSILVLWSSVLLCSRVCLLLDCEVSGRLCLDGMLSQFVRIDRPHRGIHFSNPARLFTVVLETVRGLLSAKVPTSSFAEAHSVLLPEPTHMEDEDEGNEKEDERDGEECKMESRRESKQPLRVKHG